MPSGIYPRKKKAKKSAPMFKSVDIAGVKRRIRRFRPHVQRVVESLTPITLTYRPHEYGPGHCRVRVWRNDWPHDCFEVLTHQEFDQLTKMCQRFNVSLLQADDE